MPAPNYTDFFTPLGKLVKAFNANVALQVSQLGVGTGADEILDAFGDQRDVCKTVQQDYEGFAGQVTNWNSTIQQNYGGALIGSLQDILNSPSTAPSTILPLLYSQMVINGQTINANTISDPAVSTGSAGNVGNGIFLASAKNLAGANDQRVITEFLTASCVAGATTGAPSGGEQFSVVGYPRPTVGSSQTRGSGLTSLSVFDASSRVSNGTFETFASSLPTSWTRVAGTAVTNIAQETTLFHRGAGALKLIGDGATGTITLTYSLSSLTPSTLFALNVWARKNGTVSGGSNLQIAIKGTGYTAANAFNADPSTLTTSYVAKNIFFATPAVVPSDLTLTITWTTAAAAGATAIILIDDAVVRETVQLGHVQYAAFAGSTDFGTGDQFYIVTANDYAGKFSTFVGWCYDSVLPVSGSPTISDSLAT